MPKITVPKDTTIPDPRAGAYVDGVQLSAAGELNFSKGTWDVSDVIAAIWNGTYELPANATDRRGKPLKPAPGNETLHQEPTPPINPDESLAEGKK